MCWCVVLVAVSLGFRCWQLAGLLRCGAVVRRVVCFTRCVVVLVCVLASMVVLLDFGVELFVVVCYILDWFGFLVFGLIVLLA